MTATDAVAARDLCCELRDVWPMLTDAEKARLKKWLAAMDENHKAEAAAIAKVKEKFAAQRDYLNRAFQNAQGEAS